jgi:hypothetical protein
MFTPQIYYVVPIEHSLGLIFIQYNYNCTEWQSACTPNIFECMQGRDGVPVVAISSAEELVVG